MWGREGGDGEEAGQVERGLADDTANSATQV